MPHAKLLKRAQQWHRLALSKISTKDFPATWADFQFAWEEAKYPWGTNPSDRDFPTGNSRGAAG